MFMNLKDVRKKYIIYLEKKDHKKIPSSSLVPENDPTTLFTGSGMQSLIPYLLGEKHPMGNRLVNSQKCFRAEDIEEVGDNRHTTFFEMLGNWSLGEYFKEEQLPYFFHFLVDEIGIDPNRLYVTVFSGDEKAGVGKDTESIAIWKQLFADKGIMAEVVELETEKRGGELGMQGGRIFAYGSKKNWWSRSGVPENMPLGEPGGPDSEVFYEFVSIEHDEKFGKHCHPNCDCGRFMEIGNNVFMEYVRTKEGFEKLPQRNVDFGGGLERITAASENNPDVFQVDVFRETLLWMEKNTSKTYEENKRAFRIILDHMRAVTFMIAQGIFPSNTGQGYILRRLLRRSIRFWDSLKGEGENEMYQITLGFQNYYKEMYPEILQEKERIIDEIEKEEKKFRKTLEKGLKEFEKIARRGEVNGKDAFVLFSTYGFPMEMTEELAFERNIEIDRDQYEKEFEEHRNLSRTASSGTFKGGLADSSEQTTALHTVTHLMLAGLRMYLGDHVHQAGSNITAERTRFDFTHPEKVSREILDKVEAYVNTAIQKGCRVRVEDMDKEEARLSGVEGSFWEKYPDRVHVYSVEDEEGKIYSRELCGGPHVDSTVAIRGIFRIVKEQSSSAGVRRVKAILEI